LPLSLRELIIEYAFFGAFVGIGHWARNFLSSGSAEMNSKADPY